MSCIYYIFVSKKKNYTVDGGYIGQDGENNYQRIFDHVYGAYTGTLDYGSERLIRANSACNCFFTAFEGPNYGISEETYAEFWKLWGVGELTPAMKLNLAEIFHIAYYQQQGKDLSALNKQLGGYGELKVKYRFSEGEAKALEQLAQESVWKRASHATELTLSPWDTKENYNKLLFPMEYRTMELILNNEVSNFLKSSGFKQKLLEWIRDNYHYGSRRNKTDPYIDLSTNGLQTKIRHLLQEQIEQWNQNLQDISPGIKVSFSAEDIDIPNIAERIETAIYKRLSKNLVSVKWEMENMTYDNFYQASKHLVELLTQKINHDGSVSGITIDIPLPANLTHSIKITGSRQPPKWWSLLAKDMESLQLVEIRKDILDRVKGASYKAFCDIIKKCNLSSPQDTSALANIDIRDSKGRVVLSKNHESLLEIENPTLRNKVREQYQKLGNQGAILHYWDIFYRTMVTKWMKNEKNQPEPLVLNEDFEEDSGWVEALNTYEHPYYFFPQTWNAIEKYITANANSFDDIIFY